MSYPIGSAGYYCGEQSAYTEARLATLPCTGAQHLRRPNANKWPALIDIVFITPNDLFCDHRIQHVDYNRSSGVLDVIDTKMRIFSTDVSWFALIQRGSTQPGT